MLQESPSTTWDLRNLNPGPSISTKIYILFLFAVCIVTSIKLLKVWHAAPPFRLSRQAKNPNYLELLRSSAASIKQWISFTLIVWGIFASVTVYDFCHRLFDSKALGSFILLYPIQEFSTDLTMALLVVLFAFLVRWYIVKRIENLRIS